MAEITKKHFMKAAEESADKPGSESEWESD